MKPDPQIDWDITWLDEVTSTNDLALDAAKSGCSEGAVIVAGSQTTGRGRRGNVWHSPVGGLWFSLVLRPELEGRELWGLTALSALSAVAGVRNLTGLSVGIKWPNDLYLDGRKLGGVMAESSGGAVVIGVGINANVKPADLPSVEWYPVTSLLVAGGESVDPPLLLDGILSELGERYRLLVEQGFSALLAEWRERSVVLGERVHVVCDGSIFKGTAAELDERGGIVVRLEDGTERRFEPRAGVSLGLRDSP
jgi:BirA family biotin operon repressor/biotin-[acetyl-CoA-carboxylase] ligase